MQRLQFVLLSILLVLFIAPLPVMAAEVLRVSGSSLLLVGDHNRTYTVRLACLQVDPSDEAEAMAWLKSELPRRRRVNLRPEGSSEGVLLARVTSIGSDVDLSAGLAAAGLGRLTCDSPQA
ncbi:MAG: nuclease [Cyanobacteriota bacterium]|nr:nuclease [Cyanobacteriota bacterium]